MKKNQRLSELLGRFSKEEQAFLMSLGKKKLFTLLELESDDVILASQLRDLMPQLEAKQKAKEAEKREAKRAKKASTSLPEVEEVEPIEVYAPNIGRIPVDKGVFSLFIETFSLSFNQGKRKIVNLFIYYPKRSPLVGLRIRVGDPETLFYEAFEDYLCLEGEKNWGTFVGLFSRAVFAYLERVGNKTIRRKEGGFTHAAQEVTMVSWEVLRERELV